MRALIVRSVSRCDTSGMLTSTLSTLHSTSRCSQAPPKRSLRRNQIASSKEDAVDLKSLAG